MYEYDFREKPYTNFYLLEDTIKNVAKEINQFVDNVIPDTFFYVSNEKNGNFAVGSPAWTFMRTNDRNMAEKFRKLAYDIIHNSKFIQKAEEIKSRKSAIGNRLQAFDDALKYLAQTLEQGTERLKGKCWVCDRIR